MPDSYAAHCAVYGAGRGENHSPYCFPCSLCVAYLTYAERRIIGAISSAGWVRTGSASSATGSGAWDSPLADAFKLIFKEIIIPAGANKRLFVVAPILAMAPSLAAWAVVPFDGNLVLADINAGLLIHPGPDLTGRLRRHHRRLGLQLQVRVPGGHALGSPDRLLRDRHGLCPGVCADGGREPQPRPHYVKAQSGSVLHWFWLPLLPMFLIVFHFRRGRNQSGRRFDRGRGRIGTGRRFPRGVFRGMAFSHFLHGRIRQHDSHIRADGYTVLRWLAVSLAGHTGTWRRCLLWVSRAVAWFLVKTSAFLFLFLWFRATFPRYRYDQIMRLGWKVFLPHHHHLDSWLFPAWSSPGSAPGSTE